MNRKFLNAVIQASPDGTRGGYAREYGINPARVTELIKGYRRPSASEMEKLSRAFSAYRLAKFFPPTPAKIEGVEVVNG
jgi:hypothetical protein